MSTRRCDPAARRPPTVTGRVADVEHQPAEPTTGSASATTVITAVRPGCQTVQQPSRGPHRPDGSVAPRRPQRGNVAVRAGEAARHRALACFGRRRLGEDHERDRAAARAAPRAGWSSGEWASASRSGSASRNRFRATRPSGGGLGLGASGILGSPRFSRVTDQVPARGVPGPMLGTQLSALAAARLGTPGRPDGWTPRPGDGGAVRVRLWRRAERRVAELSKKPYRRADPARACLLPVPEARPHHTNVRCSWQPRTTTTTRSRSCAPLRANDRRDRRPAPPAGRLRATADIAQEARLGLLRAIRAWQPARGPFPAFAALCARNQALRGARRRRRPQAPSPQPRPLARRPPAARQSTVKLLDHGATKRHRRTPRERVLRPARRATPRDHRRRRPATNRDRARTAPRRARRAPTMTACERQVLAGMLNDKSQRQLAAELGGP